MNQSTFDTPLIKVESLKTKFDTLVISNSFVKLIGDHFAALFLHQLHYWSYSQYGVVIDGRRWVYKPLREWLSEVFALLTDWKLRKAISLLLEKGLIERQKLYVKHHEIKYDNPYWHPKNQTYYYSVNYDKLQKLIDEAEKAEKAESTENIRFEDSTKLSIEEFLDTKYCELSQNKTEITSIENNSKNKSLPTLPVERKIKKSFSKKKDFSSVQIETVLARPIKEKINLAESEVIEKETNSATKNKIVKENNLANSATKPKPKVAKTKPGTKPKQKKKKNLAPWKDQGEFKRFYRQLLAYAKVFARNPHALTQFIITKLRRGESDPCWDDFKAGVALGSSSQQEWEIKPGVPYPMFLEYLAEKLKGSHDSVEKAYEAALKILDEPKKAQIFWSQFKRSVINVSERVESDRSLGVSNPHTPIWTRERFEPSVEEAATAGAKIMEVNNTAVVAIAARNNPQLAANNNHRLESSSEVTVPDPWTDESSTDSDDDSPKMSLREMLSQKLGSRNLKGFVKKMPQVSQAEAISEDRVEKKPKMNISRMAIAEINESLQDPIFRKELMPQLWRSDYQLITDELGQIIGVKLKT